MKIVLIVILSLIGAAVIAISICTSLAVTITGGLAAVTKIFGKSKGTADNDKNVE